MIPKCHNLSTKTLQFCYKDSYSVILHVNQPNSGTVIIPNDNGKEIAKELRNLIQENYFNELLNYKHSRNVQLQQGNPGGASFINCILGHSLYQPQCLTRKTSNPYPSNVADLV